MFYIFKLVYIYCYLIIIRIFLYLNVDHTTTESMHPFVFPFYMLITPLAFYFCINTASIMILSIFINLEIYLTFTFQWTINYIFCIFTIDLLNTLLVIKKLWIFYCPILMYTFWLTTNDICTIKTFLQSQCNRLGF